MYPPRYLKCLVKVMKPSSPMGICFVSSASSYSLLCLFRLASSLSCFGFGTIGREEEGLVGGAGDGRTGSLKWPGAGKKTHSVLEGFEEDPMCIWRPNQEKWVKTRFAPISSSHRVAKANAPLST